MSEARRIDTATTAFGSQVGAAFAREAALWVDTQRDLLSSFGTLVGDWLNRQREALDISSRSVQRIWECRNVNELVQAQQQWATDCLRLTAAQLRAAGQDANAMTQKATARFGDALREQAEELGRDGGRRRSPAPPEKTEAAAE